jgi:hypothetical protein
MMLLLLLLFSLKLMLSLRFFRAVDCATFYLRRKVKIDHYFLKTTTV